MNAVIAEKREECEKIFNSLDYPDEREEEWRYTDLSKIKIDSLERGSARPAISCEGGVDAWTTEKAPQELAEKYAYPSHDKKTGIDKIEAMNAAYWNSGFFAIARKDAKSTINIDASPGMLRNAIVAEPGSELIVTENLAGGSGLNNSSTNLFALEGSTINYMIFQGFAGAVHDFSLKRAFLQRNATIRWHFCIAGGSFTRTRIDTMLNGSGAAAECAGVFLGKANQHIDVTTNAYHNVPSTTNLIDTKGCLSGNASAVFRGVIRIGKAGQQTSSYMSNHTLKLSAESIANTIPSLFIDANDVKASHAATVGQIDEEQLFYLKSRGLPQPQAERMIVNGFFEPVIKRMQDDDFKERVRQAIRSF